MNRDLDFCLALPVAHSVFSQIPLIHLGLESAKWELFEQIVDEGFQALNSRSLWLSSFTDELGISELKIAFSWLRIIIALDAFSLKLFTHLCQNL